MKTGRFRFAGNEQAMGLPGDSQLEEQKAVARLMDLLDTGLGQDRRKLSKHALDFRGG
jgi:hypothetical protein